MAYLEVQGIWKAYGPTTVLKDVSFALEERQVLCLLGPSGCGKTTMLRVLAGLVQQDEGSVWLGGREISRVPTHKRAIGMVFQRWALFPHMSVADNVAFGLKMQAVPPKERASRVAEALDLVRLGEYAKRRPHQLSGGQQQRVALARTLVTNPKLVLFDEPLSSLDAKLRNELRHELRQLQRELGFTAVYVTHDQAEALTLSDHVAVMRVGEIVEAGAPRQLFTRPRTRYVADFLGVANFLRGTTTAVDGEQIVFRLEAGPTIRVDAAEVPASRRGRVTEIGLRAEGVSVAPARSGTAGLRGEIRAREYQASRFGLTTRLSTTGELLYSYESLTSDLAEGQAVDLSCDWSSAFALDPDGTRPGNGRVGGAA